ncbi:MAG: hypothetical protein ACD_37C00502G0002 [uncultured bacterium]|nr:MAG: hypothetical protein ACD_37C00502G0002 [uncultured bacterium]
MAEGNIIPEAVPLDFSEDKLGGNRKKTPSSNRAAKKIYDELTSRNKPPSFLGNPDDYARLLEANGVHPIDAHHKALDFAETTSAKPKQPTE